MTIELHTWNTPNGRKISVALEEMGLPYKVIPVNITKGEQMAPSFLAISPNNKIPAIVDPEGPDGKPVSIFESGAILLYLGEKTGKFLPKSLAERIPVYEVRPGVIATDMTARVREIYDKRIADGLVPEGRWGQPDDVGRAVAALLRGDIAYATGTIVNVDGGLSIPRL